MKLFITILVILLTLLYFKKKDRFTNLCLGARDGVSGCRTCCADRYPNKYNDCVSRCMNHLL